MTTYLSKIFKLPAAERILLIEAIWVSIKNETGKENPNPLTKEQIHFLEEEIASHAINPEEASALEEIIKRIPHSQ